LLFFCCVPQKDAGECGRSGVSSSLKHTYPCLCIGPSAPACTPRLCSNPCPILVPLLCLSSHQAKVWQTSPTSVAPQSRSLQLTTRVSSWTFTVRYGPPGKEITRIWKKKCILQPLSCTHVAAICFVSLLAFYVTPTAYALPPSVPLLSTNIDLLGRWFAQSSGHCIETCLQSGPLPLPWHASCPRCFILRERLKLWARPWFSPRAQSSPNPDPFTASAHSLRSPLGHYMSDIDAIDDIKVNTSDPKYVTLFYLNGTTKDVDLSGGCFMRCPLPPPCLGRVGCAACTDRCGKPYLFVRPSAKPDSWLRHQLDTGNSCLLPAILLFRSPISPTHHQQCFHPNLALVPSAVCALAIQALVRPRDRGSLGARSTLKHHGACVPGN
jgi:hypothetical protein